MSEDRTQDLTDERSFEERIFARFDALDARLDRIDSRLDNVEVRLSNVEVRLSNVEGRLSNVESHLSDVDTRLQNLESESERRAVETKPIWERALAEIMALSEKFDTLNEKFDVLTSDMFDLRASQKRLNKRVDRLESA
jgi:chromosome segregation ATPase